MPSIITIGAMSARGFGFGSKAAIVTGSQSYTTPGTYTWIAPAGVTSVSVVAVGGGGGAQKYYCCCGAGAGVSGGGGGLGYKNNYTVIPGNSYSVVVGGGGAPAAANGTPGPGGSSSFVSTAVVKGGGVAGCNVFTSHGTFTGDGGGNAVCPGRTVLRSGHAKPD